MGGGGVTELLNRHIVEGKVNYHITTDFFVIKIMIIFVLLVASDPKIKKFIFMVRLEQKVDFGKFKMYSA
jgi:hypothetical protein